MKTRRANSDRVVSGAILFIFAMGLVLLAMFLWENHTVNLVKKWPTTEATIVNSHITSSTNLIEGDMGNIVTKNDELYFAFSYQVNSVKYVSHNFYPDGELIEKPVITDLPVGHHFFARYNPQTPEIAVVEPGSVHYRFLVVAVICLGLTAAGLIYNFRIS
jgi:hypothetical protein